MSLFESMRDVVVSRLRAREKFWREKERGDLSATSDTFRIRAEEAAACADVVAGLKPGYAAPETPDMRAAAASRGEGKHG